MHFALACKAWGAAVVDMLAVLVSKQARALLWVGGLGGHLGLCLCSRMLPTSCYHH